MPVHGAQPALTHSARMRIGACATHTQPRAAARRRVCWPWAPARRRLVRRPTTPTPPHCHVQLYNRRFALEPPSGRGQFRFCIALVSRCASMAPIPTPIPMRRVRTKVVLRVPAGPGYGRHRRCSICRPQQRVYLQYYYIRHALASLLVWQAAPLLDSLSKAHRCECSARRLAASPLGLRQSKSWLPPPSEMSGAEDEGTIVSAL